MCRLFGFIGNGGRAEPENVIFMVMLNRFGCNIS